MKQVQKMKLTMNNTRLFAMVIMAVILGLVACGSKNVANGEDDYPMRGSTEENCMRHLYHVLMSPEGYVMKGAQLAVLRDTGELRNVFRIDLPVCSDDQLPRMGTYREAGKGASFEFLPLEEDPLDTIHAVCQAIVDFGYEGGTPDSMLVHNRGNGILTLFRYVHRGGPYGGKHRCYDKHPDGYPEYSAIVLSVYQGGDSLIISSGYKDSKCVYRYE